MKCISPLTFDISFILTFRSLFAESGFRLWNYADEGNPIGIISSQYDLSQHVCARSCLADASCNSFLYRSLDASPICVLYRYTTRDKISEPVHRYEKSMVKSSNL